MTSERAAAENIPFLRVSLELTACLWAAERPVTDSSKPLPGQRFRSRTLYVEGHDSRVSSPTSGTPLLPILMS